MNARRLTHPVAQLMQAFTTFRPDTRAVAV